MEISNNAACSDHQTAEQRVDLLLEVVEALELYLAGHTRGPRHVLYRQLVAGASIASFLLISACLMLFTTVEFTWASWTSFVAAFFAAVGFMKITEMLLQPWLDRQQTWAELVAARLSGYQALDSSGWEGLQKSADAGEFEVEELLSWLRNSELVRAYRECEALRPKHKIQLSLRS